jgi:hypothetical protein
MDISQNNHFELRWRDVRNRVPSGFAQRVRLPYITHPAIVPFWGRWRARPIRGHDLSIHGHRGQHSTLGAGTRAHAAGVGTS